MEKIELHAHLSGCMRFTTLNELYIRQYGQSEKIVNQTCSSLEQCFVLFSMINKLNLTRNDLRRIVKEIFEDFMNDGVKYLELRATPKKGQDFDQLLYLQTISEEIDVAKIEVKLVVAVDRGKGLDEAEKTYQIVKKNKIKHLIAVDLCGHPGVGTFLEYRPILQKFRDLGYRITVHMGELIQSIKENDDVLDFAPDRIGHLIYFTKEQLDRVKYLQIPVEVCFSSNLFTTNMEPKNHPIKQFIEQGIPVTICTDDTLCFNTTVSKEISLIQSTFNYSEELMKQIIKGSHEYKFKK